MALPVRVSRGMDPFEALHREMDSMLGRFFGPTPEYESTWMAPYAVDIREDADHIYVDAELPGFKKDEIEVTLENQTLTISAERKSEKKKEGNGEQTLLHERRHARYLRSFTLPPTVNEQKCDAKLVDGVLQLTLNKREETKPKRITVQ